MRDLPLYPSEDQIAKAVLGPRRAADWKANAVVLERHGLPPIDPLMGGRYWPAVKRYFDDRAGLGFRLRAGEAPGLGESECPPTRMKRRIPA
jgi:hypothetical protein